MQRPANARLLVIGEDGAIVHAARSTLADFLKPGDLVRVRRGRWRVVDTRPYDACQIITLSGADAASAGIERRVITPFDVVERIARVGRIEDAGLARLDPREVGVTEAVGVRGAGEIVETGAAALEKHQQPLGARVQAHADAGVRAVAALGARDRHPGPLVGRRGDGIARVRAAPGARVRVAVAAAAIPAAAAATTSATSAAASAAAAASATHWRARLKRRLTKGRLKLPGAGTSLRPVCFWGEADRNAFAIRLTGKTFGPRNNL